MMGVAGGHWLLPGHHKIYKYLLMEHGENRGNTCHLRFSLDELESAHIFFGNALYLYINHGQKKCNTPIYSQNPKDANLQTQQGL